MIKKKVFVQKQWKVIVLSMERDSIVSVENNEAILEQFSVFTVLTMYDWLESFAENYSYTE